MQNPSEYPEVTAISSGLEGGIRPRPRIQVGGPFRPSLWNAGHRARRARTRSPHPAFGGRLMAPPATPAPLNLGFLTVVQESGGYLGGYLVTNNWGRPLEFRLSSAVQPNRVHQILYGGTLKAYVCADLIGKALVEKTATPMQLLLTDSEPVLDLRLKVATPVVWLAPADDPLAAALTA